jgi:hypothetical protein
MTTNYLKRYCGQTLKFNEDVADRNQDGLTGWRKTLGNWVVEIGWRLARIEGAGDIYWRRAWPTEGCRADDEDDDDYDDDDDDDDSQLCRSRWPRGLRRQLDCWDRGFESR